MKSEDQRGNAYKLPWSRPKAIMNKAARSRGRWRMASFPDREGIVCYQTFIGAWPKSTAYNERIISAVLNAPVANAFVSTREGKTDITMETLHEVPVPHLTEAQKLQIESLIERYLSSLEGLMSVAEEPQSILKQIDAVVLNGYRMPPRLERQLLDWFRGQARPVPHPFSDYFPESVDVFFSLSEFLSSDFALTTAEQLHSRLRAYRQG
jgi:hypothetical protein